MPGDITDDLIRTTYSNLENPSWWRSLNADGVVLYAWGKPQYTKIAKAIHASGALLVSSIDGSALLSPYRHFFAYTNLLYFRNISQKGLFLGSVYAFASLTRALIPQFFDKKRLRHLSYADTVLMVTPQAVDTMKELAAQFGYLSVSKKISYAPHPQLADYYYDGRKKDNSIITVGRWAKKDWHQKNPKLLLQSASIFLTYRPDYTLTIVGTSSDLLMPLVNRYAANVKSQIELVPFVKPQDLRELYVKAKIGLWTSRHEGQQNAAAQALCCGCSVVATNGISMSCFTHYISYASGRQSVANDPTSLAYSISLEIDEWDQGMRDAEKISMAWCDEFHSCKVANRIIKLVGQSRNSLKCL